MTFKVQPWTLFKASLATFWMQQRTLLIIAVVPVLVLLCGLGIGLLLFFNRPSTWSPIIYFVFIFLMVALPILYASLSIYLSWFRYMFRLEEKPRWFRLDFMRHVRLLWAIVKTLAFCALPLFGAFLGVAVSGLFEPENMTAGRFVTVVLLLALPLAWFAFSITRLGLYLPAVTLDEPVKLRNAFSETKGNFWRMFALAVLIGLLHLLGPILDWALPLDSGSTTVIVANLVGTFLIIWLTFGVNLTSSAELYRAWLVSKMEPQAGVAT